MIALCLLLLIIIAYKLIAKRDTMQNFISMNSDLTIDLSDVKHPVSEMLFGLFLEDINFSVDGGLNANMVNNHSFDGVFLKKGGAFDSIRLALFKKPLNPVNC